jgi:hypothetical protein
MLGNYWVSKTRDLSSSAQLHGVSLVSKIFTDIGDVMELSELFPVKN